MSSIKKPVITEKVTNARKNYLKLKELLAKSELELAKQYSDAILQTSSVRGNIKDLLSKAGFNVDVNDVYFSKADLTDDYCNSVYYYVDVNKLSSPEHRAEYSILVGGYTGDGDSIDYEGAIYGEYEPDGYEGEPVFYDDIVSTVDPLVKEYGKPDDPRVEIPKMPEKEIKKVKDMFDYLLDRHEEYNDLLYSTGVDNDNKFQQSVS